MNQESIKQLLSTAELSRADFADMIGCHVKTTYWPEPPTYAYTILTLYIGGIKHRRFFDLLRELRE